MTNLGHTPVPVAAPPAAGGPVRLMGYACAHCQVPCPADTICYALVAKVTRHQIGQMRKRARRVAARLRLQLQVA